MEEQFQTISASPNSIFSDFSSYDSAVESPHSSTLSAMPMLSSIRGSATFADMRDITNTFEHQDPFLSDFHLQRSNTMLRCQSNTDNLNLQFEPSNQQLFSTGSYPIDESLIDRHFAPFSITGLLNSSMPRLSTSASAMPLPSIGRGKSYDRRLVRPTATNLFDHPILPHENINLLPSTPFSSSRRQTLSAFHDTSSSSTHMTAPSLYSHPQAQVLHSANRSTSMPTWRGSLPIKFDSITFDQHHTNTPFSQKVFLGGISPDLTEAELLLVLRQFGKCNIKWPKNDGLTHNKPGFCHVVFRESRSVNELLKHCTRQQQTSTIDYFLHIHMSSTSTSTAVGAPIRPSRLRPIQVVPWNVKDNVHVMHRETISNSNDTFNKDWSRTIFVSPLHGKMTALSLATVMCNVFGAVSMAQINTDKYGYPTGTGTVLFVDSHSYMRAVAAGVIDIKCDCFHKLLDIDPFLRENEPCAFCTSVADLFCRNFHCLRSYCRQCWVNKHGPRPLADHQPATRRQHSLVHL